MPGEPSRRDPERGGGKTRLTFCLRNVDFATRDRLIAEHRATPVGCLGKCSLCFDSPFMEIDGRTCTGENHEVIVERHRASDACSEHEPGEPGSAGLPPASP